MTDRRCTTEEQRHRRPRRSETVLAWAKALAPYAAAAAAIIVKLLGD